MAMTPEEATAFWKGRIDKVIEGLTILNAYPFCMMSASHDELVAGPDGAKISPEDQDRLKALGWREHSESGWAIFV